MGSAFSKTKSKSESPRSSAVPTFDSLHDAVPANSSPSRKTNYNSTLTTFKVHREQTQTYKAVRTSTTSIISGTSKGPAHYSPVYKRRPSLSQDAQRIEASPVIGIRQEISRPETSDKYDLTKKAYVLVFHHHKFKNTKENRPGSMQDMDKINAVLKKYRTEKPQIHENCSLQSVRQVMDGVSRKDFSKYSCLIVFIMSHGNTRDTILAYDGEMYSLDDDIVEKCTSNSTLTGKPKIFVSQACRGEAAMETDATKKVVTKKSDIVKFLSTYAGTVSYRNVQRGSFFMQEFLDLLQSSGSSVDVHDINMQLNARFNKEGINQTPTIESTLKKKLFLNDLRKK